MAVEPLTIKSARCQMNTLRLLNRRESQIETTLLRQLAPKGYHVYPKMRLSDVIGRQRGEFLPKPDFDYLCRAPLDFIVSKDCLPNHRRGVRRAAARNRDANA